MKRVSKQYSYFGARYYDSDLSVWLSVDAMSDKYPSMSAYMYCGGNPVMIVDPDGRDWFESINEDGSKSVKWNKSTETGFTDQYGTWTNIGKEYSG